MTPTSAGRAAQLCEWLELSLFSGAGEKSGSGRPKGWNTGRGGGAVLNPADHLWACQRDASGVRVRRLVGSSGGLHPCRGVPLPLCPGSRCRPLASTCLI